MIKKSIKYPHFWLALIIIFIFPAEILTHYFLKSFDLTFFHFAIINASITVLILLGSLTLFLYKPHLNYLRNTSRDDVSILKREERYRMIFENVQDVYYEVSGSGTILEVSPSIKNISKGQYNRNELLGTSVYDLYPDPNERDQILSLLKSKGCVTDQEIRMKNKDGTIFHCSISARLWLDENNQPLKITGIMRDISVRKQAEQNIRQKNEELRVINSEKDKLFSIIAHDLRTPFNAFIGLTEIMVRKSSTISAAELEKFAGSMHTTAVNLYSLLENLLLWSGNRQGNIPFNPKNLDLQSLILDCACTLKESAERKNISLVYDIPENVRVYADPNAFQTILRNLLSNAIKFTHREGRITVAARESASDRIEISCSDTGIGIEPEVLDNLFSIHSKINRLGTEGEPSTGLGLLLCKEFVEKHGGTMMVSSEPGQGSSFSFTVSQAN
jgi:PAS domain S-box-containing protein